MSGSQDPIGVAAFISGPAGIDEERLSRRAHYQSRLPAFNVDEINLQRFAGGSCGTGASRQEQEGTQAQSSKKQSSHRLAPDGNIAEDYATRQREYGRDVFSFSKTNRKTIEDAD
jgi:hypothetical protein